MKSNVRAQRIVGHCALIAPSPTEGGAGVIKGGCNCGLITYEVKVKGDSVPVLFCHCQDCREAHGSPFTGVVAARESDITWTNREKCVTYNRRGSNNRHWCSVCGAHMCSHLTAAKVFAIFTPSIKESPPLKPGMHIYVSEKDPLITLPEDGLPRFIKGPGSGSA